MNSLYWVRNDLRFHDNLALDWLRDHATSLLVIYFLPQDYLVWGPERRSFLKQSLEAFADSLKRCDVDFHVSLKNPEEEIPQLIKTHQLDALVYSEEHAHNERKIEENLKRRLCAEKIKIVTFDQATLIKEADLPFSLHELPDLFTNFKNKIETGLTIKPAIMPKDFRLKSLQYPQEKIDWGDLKSHPLFFGGEASGLARLADYFWNTDSIQHYFETRNGMMEFNDSSKLSPWLANGSLSPRMIYQELVRYEETRLKNKSTSWLVYELLWRDYFKFYAKKYQSKIFLVNGIRSKKMYFKDDLITLQSWMQGETGEPFIDANMKELLHTGWMSNRGRQNVANFLAKTLKVNWTWGADWFEKRLIDYDPCNNWGNWNYTAGVGTDQRDRTFNPQNQSRMYDPENIYQKKWLN
jgi:deoxyribodipyrimidine photo-lyase